MSMSACVKFVVSDAEDPGCKGPSAFIIAISPAIKGSILSAAALMGPISTRRLIDGMRSVLLLEMDGTPLGKSGVC